MRTATAATLLALCSTVLGWEVTLYRYDDCNDSSYDFDYMIVSGTDDNDCQNMESKEFVNAELGDGMDCTYYSRGGEYHSPCNGQIRTFQSFRVREGQVWIYTDGSCSEDKLHDGPYNPDSGSDTGCVSAVYGKDLIEQKWCPGFWGTG